ncbi:MAG: hypothetical protein GY702_16900 [Desulfobulbaceae bacterium]|nr:hypothetical protein [Desulfobulbaceae bacterium]
MVHKKDGKKPHKGLWALKLKPIQSWFPDQTSGAFQDRFGFSPSFLPLKQRGKPEDSRSGVAKGSQ